MSLFLFILAILFWRIMVAINKRPVSQAKKITGKELLKEIGNTVAIRGMLNGEEKVSPYTERKVLWWNIKKRPISTFTLKELEEARFLYADDVRNQEFDHGLQSDSDIHLEVEDHKIKVNPQAINFEQIETVHVKTKRKIKKFKTFALKHRWLCRDENKRINTVQELTLPKFAYVTCVGTLKENNGEFLLTSCYLDSDYSHIYLDKKSPQTFNVLSFMAELSCCLCLVLSVYFL